MSWSVVMHKSVKVGHQCFKRNGTRDVSSGIRLLSNRHLNVITWQRVFLRHEQFLEYLLELMIPRFTPFIARLQHSTSRALFLEKKFTDGNPHWWRSKQDYEKKKKDLQLERHRNTKYYWSPWSTTFTKGKVQDRSPKRIQLAHELRIKMNKSSATVSNHPIPAKHSAS